MDEVLAQHRKGFKEVEAELIKQMALKAANPRNVDDSTTELTMSTVTSEGKKLAAVIQLLQTIVEHFDGARRDNAVKKFLEDHPEIELCIEEARRVLAMEITTTYNIGVDFAKEESDLTGIVTAISKATTDLESAVSEGVAALQSGHLVEVERPKGKSRGLTCPACSERQGRAVTYGNGHTIIQCSACDCKWELDS